MLEELTEPDEQISADNMEALSLKLLSELPMEGVEGSSLDADVIWKTEGYYPGNSIVQKFVNVVCSTSIARP